MSKTKFSKTQHRKNRLGLGNYGTVSKPAMIKPLRRDLESLPSTTSFPSSYNLGSNNSNFSSINLPYELVQQVSTLPVIFGSYLIINSHYRRS